MHYRTRRACPRCARSLQLVEAGAGSAWGCDGCGGVLLDDAAFAHVREAGYALIVERAGRSYVDVPAVDESAPLQCPECAKPMQRTLLDEIPVDFCREHGTWFDAQELLAVALALSRARRASQRAPAPDESLPYAASPETAEQLEWLKHMLRVSIDRLETAEILRRLEAARRDL